MTRHKIIFLFMFMSISCSSFCQNVNDSSLNKCLSEIKNEKFDSVGSLKEIPVFISKKLKQKCGKDFHIFTDKDYRKKFKRNPYKADLYRFEFAMSSARYYLVRFWHNGDPYSTGYLAIFKCEQNKVVESYVLSGVFYRSMDNIKNNLIRDAGRLTLEFN